MSVRLVSDRYPQLWVPRLGVRFADGVAEVDDGAATALLARGIDGVRRADEQPESEDDQAIQESADAPAVSPPARAEPKSAWVDYAVDQGAERAAAEAMTKAELVERWG